MPSAVFVAVIYLSSHFAMATRSRVQITSRLMLLTTSVASGSPFASPLPSQDWLHVPLEHFLQLSRVPRQLLTCLPPDHERNQQFADPVPFEIECERYARPFAVIERLNSALGNPRDRDAADTAETPALRGVQLRHNLGRWHLPAADPPGHHSS